MYSKRLGAEMDQMTQQIESWGEVGIDTEASPGNGQYYVKCYVNGYDALGFDTEEEALLELEFLIQNLKSYKNPDGNTQLRFS